MADVRYGRDTTADQSTSELVQQAGEQISRLIRDEFALAKAELTEKGRHAGIGVGLFGGGGVLALYALGVLIVSLVLGLVAAGLTPWLAALLVGVVLLAVAGVLALLGRSQVQQAAPPKPESAMRSVQADIDTVKTAVRERGRA
ncbi:MAG TPA: phage holin family protein [Pilimelia sp.]|nr:phage holin family protein [Pilimelia sp.]